MIESGIKKVIGKIKFYFHIPILLIKFIFNTLNYN